jgi:UDP-2-acetamido-2,6-beta-L-arabino-hexul-4-ose reductase
MSTKRRVLITGSNGFIGSNLQLHLAERQDVEIVRFTREQSVNALEELVVDVDFVFHLAGVNRPEDPSEFDTGNASLTEFLCDALVALARKTGRRIPVIYTSSTQALKSHPYGRTKREAEEALFKIADDNQIPVHVFRLPNVFGKWCKPNYNSVVATFCHNISRGLPIQINDPAAAVTLVYVDDVVDRFLQLMDGSDARADSDGFEVVTPTYTITIEELARQIQLFKDSRLTLVSERVGMGLVRALYSTYVSYFPTERFSYEVPKYGDVRGVFVEMLKTPDCGQFSYFTAHPGVTRGGHYHHSKTEKFLVIKGHACFKFRHMRSDEKYELITNGDKPEIVETVPGWTHDITNIGDDEMVVMLWANEVFDRSKPDTFACPL